MDLEHIINDVLNSENKLYDLYLDYNNLESNVDIKPVEYRTLFGQVFIVTNTAMQTDHVLLTNKAVGVQPMQLLKHKEKACETARIYHSNSST